MKTLGLIGGMSWESTALYYAALNRSIGERLGGLHSAEMVLGSVDFQSIVDLQQKDEWALAGDKLAEIARRLEGAGANFIALAVNTMHRVSEPIAKAVSIPMLDIRNAVADAILASGAKRVALLGTRYVVGGDYYHGYLAKALGLRCEVLRLPKDQEDFVHDAIYGELSRESAARDTQARSGFNQNPSG